MRKHDVRKWLHAILDLLPVIIIPVFMIYSHRHDVTENVQVQYKYESNEVNTLDDLVLGNIYYINEFIFNSSNNNNDTSLTIVKCKENPFINADFIDQEGDDFNFDNVSLSIYVIGNIDYESSLTLSFNVDNNLYFNTTDELILNDVIFIYNDNTFKDYLDYNNLLPQYTDYNVIESVDIENTDVMDSFMNHFNNTIDKHFNMGNVFNLNGVYQWFNTNIFNGNAPQVIYSIWNIALYELVMDLLFLLYGLFMWFIDMVEKLMEKPINCVR